MHWIILGAMLLALPALADDGDAYVGGAYQSGKAIMLCDGDIDAGDCNADLGQKPMQECRRGPVTFEIAQQTTCSACVVDINWASHSVAGGSTAVGCTNCEHDITTLDCGGQTAFTLDAGVPFPGFVHTEIVSETACATTGLTVVMHCESR